MNNLNEPMSNIEISKLDNFEKIQLYHNVYYNIPYNQLPSELKKIFSEDEGLTLIKSVLMYSNLQNPYEIAKLIKALNPAKPQTLQEIYDRALYLADICDTSVEKILRSNIFNVKDFIPQVNENIIKKILINKNLGSPTTLYSDDYTPSEDSSSSSDDTIIDNGSYKEEKKIYFIFENNSITCSENFNSLLEKLPKLPEAELIIKNNNIYQNITSTSCYYNEESTYIDFDFMQSFNNNLKIFTIHYTPQSIILNEKDLIINAGF